MRLIYALKQELKKTVVNTGFFVCVLITLILFLLTTCYVDVNTGKSYSVIETLLFIKHQKICEDVSFASCNIIQWAVSGYFLMFIPIIAAFPFIPNFCAERNSGLIRFTIQRSGRMLYYVTKFLSALLGGGLAVLLAYMIFMLIIYLNFPSLNSYSLSDEMLALYKQNAMPINIIKSIFGIFIFGAMAVVPAFLISSFVKNRYLITCIPFMVVYLFSTSLTKLSYDGMEKNKPELIKIAQILKPETITKLSHYEETVRGALIINFIFLIVSFIAFVLIMNRRWDLGE